jgi:hypothetical protein
LNYLSDCKNFVGKDLEGKYGLIQGIVQAFSREAEEVPIKPQDSCSVFKPDT